MIKTTLCLTLLMSTTFPLYAQSLKLECVDHGDGTYSCVEISNAPSASSSSPGPELGNHIEPDRLEKAKAECTYKQPRKRPSSHKTGGAALRVEQEKAAREAYNRCLLETAENMKSGKPNRQ